jgi:hypothetical protein
VGDFAGSAQLAASGSATLRKLASADDASMNLLDLATSAMLIVLPARVRNPEMTVQYAERLVALDHRRTPEYPFFLAQAYSANGQEGQAVATSKEGLALLPAPQPGAPITRARRLLEFETRTNSARSAR